MRVYLDVCCLKRPFDDQGQPRMRIESEAVLALLGAPAEQVELLHAPAQDLENDQNPLAWRAAIVTAWLAVRPAVGLDGGRLASRTDEIIRLGFRGFDALHLASAELAGRLPHGGRPGSRKGQERRPFHPRARPGPGDPSRGGLPMTTLIADPAELRRRGFLALVEKLGWVNAVQFIRQYEAGQGNYAHDRDVFLPDWDAQTLVERAARLNR